jgi:hypothetical protein
VVGRELHTMCPTGEDHPGHDWQGARKRGLHNSRGPNMMIGSKNLKPTMMACMALNWVRATDQKDSFLMSYVLPA